MADTESRSIAKQIKRYAQVGGVVGKLATKLASQKYLGVKLDKEKHALEIRNALGGKTLNQIFKRSLEGLTTISVCIIALQAVTEVFHSFCLSCNASYIIISLNTF